jgi:hypothetical protein
MFSDDGSLLLNIGGKCSRLRAKAAHISGHLPLIIALQTMVAMLVLFCGNAVCIIGSKMDPKILS